MNLTTIIVLNALLDLGAVLAVLGLVLLTHRLPHRHETAAETLHPSRPLPLRLVLPADEAEELAEAA